MFQYYYCCSIATDTDTVSYSAILAVIFYFDACCSVPCSGGCCTTSVILECWCLCDSNLLLDVGASIIISTGACTAVVILPALLLLILVLLLVYQVNITS